MKGDKRKRNPGQPQKLIDRDERAIIREIPDLRDSVGSFTAKLLKKTAGIDERVCDETVHLRNLVMVIITSVKRNF